MGANPAGPASRANRAGKAVLYCADKEDTAIAEVRPIRGFLVTVAELRVRESLRVMDLLKVSEAINPFLMEGDLIPYWMSFDDLLSRLAWSLASPLERDDTPDDYLPSQLIAEYAERVGFDGIRYPSAMKSGTANIVLFNTAACEFVTSGLVKVTKVDIQYTREVWRLTQDYPDY